MDTRSEGREGEFVGRFRRRRGTEGPPAKPCWQEGPGVVRYTVTGPGEGGGGLGGLVHADGRDGLAIACDMTQLRAMQIVVICCGAMPSVSTLVQHDKLHHVPPTSVVQSDVLIGARHMC